MPRRPLLKAEVRTSGFDSTVHLSLANNDQRTSYPGCDNGYMHPSLR